MLMSAFSLNVNRMTHPLAHRKKRLVYAATALTMVVVVLCSWLVYTNLPRSSSFSWEGGQWSETLTSDSGWKPFPVEYKGDLYLFYEYVTKDTISPNDDAIGPWARGAALRTRGASRPRRPLLRSRRQAGGGFARARFRRNALRASAAKRRGGQRRRSC